MIPNLKMRVIERVLVPLTKTEKGADEVCLATGDRIFG